jgi:hypothetical protein
MVMEELELFTGIPANEITRADLPVSGPIIINELTGWPYTTAEFRRKWRLLADLAGIPKHVTNRDSNSAGKG